MRNIQGLEHRGEPRSPLSLVNQVPLSDKGNIRGKVYENAKDYVGYEEELPQ